MPTSSAKILVFAPYPNGGLPEHVFYQCQALQKAGLEIICLATPTFLEGRELPGTIQRLLLDAPPAGSLPPMRRKLHFLWRTIRNQWLLAWHVLVQWPDLILLDTFAEYFAPFWVWPHLLLARLAGFRYAANLHDPLRNYLVGPGWWHRLSTRMAYWPLDFVLVHSPPPVAAVIPARVRVVEVPVGIYDLRATPADRASIRRAWQIADHESVFLAFGAIRDNKNIDLLIHALASHPQAILVVTGQVASSNQKPLAYYQELAQSLRVASQCRFFPGFVPDEELQGYFAATDFVALTYAGSFHSQSGVLNIAARAQRPVLASCAPGPMQQVIERFQLGIYIVPDSQTAVTDGMGRLLRDPVKPDWDGYAAFASWDTNVAGLLAAAGFPIGRVVGSPEK